jgi:hypothetical protein
MGFTEGGNRMSITITDPALIAALEAAAAGTPLRHPDGHIICQVAAPYSLPPGVKSPFTPEEVAEYRKQKTGRPLADILRDLEAGR